MTTIEAHGSTAPVARVGADRPPSGDARGGPFTAPLQLAGTVAVMLLVEYTPMARAWGWARLVLQRRPLRHVAGLRFAKVLGSGHEGGFGLRPSGSRQGLFLVFDDETSARQFIASSPVLARYRTHAKECCVALLRAASSKGSWSGAAMVPTTTLPADGPVAALTRASIRPRHLRAFWSLSPASEAALAASPGCELAVGLGEAPLLRQCTFSLWDSVASMDAYARSGAHLLAIRTAYAGDFFSEAMFVRFAVLDLQGAWKGRVYGG